MLRNWVKSLNLRQGIRMYCRRSDELLGEALIPLKREVDRPIEVSSTSVPVFDKKLIMLLESLSLSRFADEQAVVLLRNTVMKAMRLQEVELSDDAQMMFTVWEDLPCRLDDDVPSDPLPVEDLFSNAAKVQDGYFVSPPGNIALEEAAKLDLILISQWDRIGMSTAPLPKTRKTVAE